MEVLYSGRFDILDEEEPTLKLFISFTKYASSSYTIITREDKEKDEVTPTKVHYHFLIKSKKKHDTLRAKMTELGWKGPLASLSNAVSPPKRTLEKSHHYVLKQQNVVFSSLTDSELIKLKQEAKEYNDELVLKPQFDHHFRDYIMPEMVKGQIIYRGDIVVFIIKYVTKYNQNERDVKLNLPTQNEMLRYIQYYEMKTQPSLCVASILNDYRHIDGIWKTSQGEQISKMNEEIAEKRVKLLEKVNKLTPMIDIDDFIDSSDES